MCRDDWRKKKGGYWGLVAGVLLLAAEGCAPSSGAGGLARPMSQPLYEPAGGRVVKASWYGPGFEGRRTSSGERFNEQGLTAASPNLPLGSRVRVTNLANGRSVVVRINDRGPFVRGRHLDLSRGAAREIGLERPGVGRVRISRLDGPGGAPASRWEPGTWEPATPRSWRVSAAHSSRHFAPRCRAGRPCHRHWKSKDRLEGTQIVDNPLGDFIVGLLR